VVSPAAKRRAMFEKVVGGAREGTGKLVTTVQGWPRRQQLIAAGGALAVVVVLVLAVSLSGGGGAKTPAAKSPSAGPVNASFDTQAYSDKGVSVRVPKTWKRSDGGSYVDYTDPGDGKRKVRILVENGSGSPDNFLKVAESRLKTKSTNCPHPYARVSLTSTTIAGHDGAVLEYTCGSGEAARHGLWGALLTGGHAYSFFMTSTEDQFKSSKPIFNEMLSSYKLSG
jgi:hypothetical protein